MERQSNTQGKLISTCTPFHSPHHSGMGTLILTFTDLELLLTDIRSAVFQCVHPIKAIQIFLDRFFHGVL